MSVIKMCDYILLSLIVIKFQYILLYILTVYFWHIYNIKYLNIQKLFKKQVDKVILMNIELDTVMYNKHYTDRNYKKKKLE